MLFEKLVGSLFIFSISHGATIKNGVSQKKIRFFSPTIHSMLSPYGQVKIRNYNLSAIYIYCKCNGFSQRVVHWNENYSKKKDE